MFSQSLLSFTIINLILSTIALVINTPEDLNEFFKYTFIQKETGFYDKQDKKIKFAPGFNPSWAIYRFHHVCVKGGNDGIYVGIDGIKSISEDSENTLKASEWNDIIGSRFNDPLTAYTLENSQNMKTNPVFFANSTLFTNCNRQQFSSHNQAHFIMKIGFMYELSKCLISNLGRRKVFKNDLRLPFRYDNKY
jgi:hypothetical protein